MFKSAVLAVALFWIALANNCGSHGVKLNWTASSTPNVVYRVYRGSAHGGPYSMIGGAITSTSFLDNSVSSKATYYYVATAFNGLESPKSNEFTISIP